MATAHRIVTDRPTTEEIIRKMRHTYKVCGDRWFKIAADELERLREIEKRYEALISGAPV